MTDYLDDPWRVSVGDFPASDDWSEKARYLIACASLAPSGHNTQPWLFDIGDDWIDLYADRRRALPVIDPDDRELIMSCGAALGTLGIAARRFGYGPQVELTDPGEDSDRLARVHFGPGEPADDGEQGLFAAITRRRTDRGPFRNSDRIGPSLEACRSLAARFGVDLKPVLDADTKQAIAELVGEANRIQFDDPQFRRELAAWIHSRRLGSRDGISGHALGMPDLLSPIGRLVVRTFDLGDGVAADDQRKIEEGSPALSVLSTRADDRDAWLASGRALARVLLHLTRDGLSHSYLNQPIEVDGLRPRVAEAVDLKGHPQLLLRVGKAGQPKPSMRRPVADLIC